MLSSPPPLIQQTMTAIKFQKRQSTMPVHHSQKKKDGEYNCTSNANSWNTNSMCTSRIMNNNSGMHVYQASSRTQDTATSERLLVSHWQCRGGWLGRMAASSCPPWAPQLRHRIISQWKNTINCSIRIIMKDNHWAKFNLCITRKHTTLESFLPPPDILDPQKIPPKNKKFSQDPCNE